MFAALIVTLRETLEASLIVGILLAYLQKTDNKKHSKYIWSGVFCGVALSLVLAFVFNHYLGGFVGRAEQLYEGIAMLVAALLLTWMILWVLMQRKNIKERIENKASMHVENDHPWGLFFLSFVAVAREGIETIIFLQAAFVGTQAGNVFLGGLIGIVVAVVASYFLFKGAVKFHIKKFFTFTSVLLILFAAGLVAHSVHEFQEAMVLPIFIENLWNINGILNEKEGLGSFLKGVFGYNGNPSLLEVISYLVYLVGISLVWFKLDKSK